MLRITSTIIFLIFNCFICFSQKRHDVVGIYKLNSIFDTISYLQINSDSSFLFHKLIVNTPKDYRGKWKKDKSALILNSFNQDNVALETNKNFEILIERQNKIRILSTDSIGKVLSGVYCVVYSDGKKHVKVTDLSGEAEFKRIPVDSIIIEGFPVVKTKHIPKNRFSNYFKILTYYNWDQEIIYFHNEKWKIKRNKLIRVDEIIKIGNIKFPNEYYKVSKTYTGF